MCAMCGVCVYSETVDYGWAQVRENIHRLSSVSQKAVR